MTCNEEQVFLYVAGELPTDQQQEIRRHLRSCGACKVLYEDLKLVADMFKAMPASDLTPLEVLQLRMSASLASEAGALARITVANAQSSAAATFAHHSSAHTDK